MTIQLEQSAFVYDGDGNRVGKTEQGLGGAQTTKYLVDTNNPTGYAQVIEELRGGSVTRRYTFGHSLISQTQIINNAWQTSYYGYDGHGSTRLLTDTTGQVTDTYDYDAFGTLLASTGTTPNDHLYAGEALDANSGFYYLRARYMNPSSGRFISMDSYGGNSTDPASLHKYSYANGNPVSFTDPIKRKFLMVNLHSVFRCTSVQEE